MRATRLRDGCVSMVSAPGLLEGEGFIMEVSSWTSVGERSEGEREERGKGNKKQVPKHNKGNIFCEFGLSALSKLLISHFGLLKKYRNSI